MTKEPIPMPPRRSPSFARFARTASELSRRARIQSDRLRSLARGARTQEGRRRNVISLMAVCAAAGALIGVALGWHSQRRH